MKYKRWIYVMVSLVCLMILVTLTTAKLVGGAGWSSGFPLASVDNWMYGNGNLYTVAEDGITPGSSYFPGLMFLAMIFRAFFGYGAETAFIVFGAIVLIFFVLGSAFIVSTNKKDCFWLSIFSFLIFFAEFPSAKPYLLVAHPDIPALTSFLWGVICVNCFINKRKAYYIFFATVLFLFSGFLKQNAAFLFLGFGLYVLFSKSLSIKYKILICVSEAIAGLAVIVTVLTIDGCWHNCVTVNSLHHLLPVKKFLVYGFNTFVSNYFFILLFICYLCYRIFEKNKKTSFICDGWLCTSTTWFLFCMYGSAKDGANEGNMEAAMIAYMPFVIYIFAIFVRRLISYIKIDKIKQDYHSARHHVLYSNVFSIFVILLFAAVCIQCSRRIYTNYQQYQGRLSKEQVFSEWLNANFKNKTVAYNVFFYECLNGADVRKTTDLHTAYVWQMGGLMPDNILCNFAMKEKWDVIITLPGHDEAEWPYTFSEFRKLQTSEYPDMSSVYGELFEVYTKK